VALTSGSAEREIARLAFPAAFRNAEGTTWHSRKPIRVSPPTTSQ
jgi:hypothetical protein